MLRLLVAATWLALLPSAVLAVSPLAVDDADPVDAGHLQINAGWQYRHLSPVTLHAATLNPVLGLGGWAEVGAAFGYQRQTGAGPAADGVTDVALESKLRLLKTADEAFRLGVRIDLKLPAASRAAGLGTGKTDLGLLLVATRCWERTCFDGNAGYTAVDATATTFTDDQTFLGLAVRVGMGDRWTLLGEVHAFLASRGTGAVQFDAGARFAATDNLWLSILGGTAVGTNSPDQAGYLGLTWVVPVRGEPG